MPSAVLRTLHASKPGNVIVFTHGDVVTDVWYHDHRARRKPFIPALPIDAQTLLGDFHGWGAGDICSEFVAEAAEASVCTVEDATGGLLVGIRCHGEWWETTPAALPFTLNSLPWDPDEELSATGEATLHRQYLRTMSRSAHLLRAVNG